MWSVTQSTYGVVTQSTYGVVTQSTYGVCGRLLPTINPALKVVNVSELHKSDHVGVKKDLDEFVAKDPRYPLSPSRSSIVMISKAKMPAAYNHAVAWGGAR
jgi:hypothetical protein